MLELARDLTLPLDFTTERIAFLARTGAGKSGGMRVLQEQMIDNGQFIICIDLRAGDMWGIRASGTKAGYPVLVMGGEHGDVPLEPTAGKFVAEFLVRDRISTVLDLSDFTKADANRFMTAFSHRFYTLNRDVVHLFVDEVDVVAGEKNFDPHCLEAIQYLQTKGRKRGIGMTISTQRTALTNKTVIGQAGTLIAMQQIAPRDKKSVQEYLEGVAEAHVVKEILAALPTLKTREAFVYSPQHLGIEPARITFNSFKTFDSMRTPKPGEARKKPKKLADINLDGIKKEMAQTIEETKAKDPVELRKRIADLEAELAKAKSNAPVTSWITIKDALLERAEARGKQERDKEWRPKFKAAERINKGLLSLVGKINELSHLNGEAPEFPEAVPELKPEPVAVAAAPVRPAPLPRAAKKVVESETGELVLLDSHKRILKAFYWLRNESREPEKVAFYAGYTVNGHFRNQLGSLRSHGLVSDWQITQEGADTIVAEAGEKPTGAALCETIRAKLSAGEIRLFEAMRRAGQSRLTTEELAADAGYTINGHFRNQLGHLRSIGVAEGYEKDGGTKLHDAFLS